MNGRHLENIMHSMVRKLLAFALPIALIGILPAAQASRADRLATFEKFAGAPVAQFRYFQLTGSSPWPITRWPSGRGRTRST